MSAKASIKYLTKEEIIKSLEARLGVRRFTLFHEEVKRETGMDISYSHLFNIVRGDREPNQVVMKYLGGEVVKGETEYKVYQIGRPAKRSARKRSAKGRDKR